MRIMNTVYINLNNTFYKLNRNISKKTKNLLIFISCFLLFFRYFYVETKLIYINGNPLRFIETAVVVCPLIIMFCGINKQIENVKWNKLIMIPYQILAISFFIMNLVYNHDYYYVVMSIEMIVLFPLLYIAYFKDDSYKYLFDCLAISSVVITSLYFLECFFFAKHAMLMFTDSRLRATNANANFLGAIEALSGISSLYLINKYNDRIYKIILFSISFAMSFVMLYMTACRVGILEVVGSVLCFIVFNMKNIDKINYKIVISKILLIFFSLLFFTIILWPCKNVLIDIQNKETIKRNLTNVIEKANVLDVGKRFDTTEGIESLSMSRVKIWKFYISKLNVLGNDYNKITTVDLQKYGLAVPYWPHNNYIEAAYRYGVPIGILYTVLIAIICSNCLLMLFKKKHSDNSILFLIMICCAYFVSSLFECTLSYNTFAIPQIFLICIGYLVIEQS